MSLSVAFRVLLVAALVAAQSETTSPPPQSVYTPPPVGAANAALPPVSYSYTYTVTTATTAWRAPTFQTATPSVAPCSDTMCPDLDHMTCQDSMGNSYGILCDTRFIGYIITTSGKHKRGDQERDLEEAALAASSLGEREAGPEADVSLEDREINARTFTRTFDGCADACDMVEGCVGMSFNAGFAGNCHSLASIEGSFPAVGEVAAVKQ